MPVKSTRFNPGRCSTVFRSHDGSAYPAIRAIKETYERIRIGANFEKEGSDSDQAADAEKTAGVKVNTVISADNYWELPQIVDLTMNLALGWCSLSTSWCSKTRLLWIRRPFEAKSRRNFTKRDASTSRRGVLVKVELFNKRSVKSCDFPWKRNFVSYDGYVHPCCYTTQTGDRKAQNRRSSVI